MFLTECCGLSDRFSRSRKVFLSKEYEYLKNLTELKELNHTSYESILLFKNDYHKGSALRRHYEDLFQFARKYFQFLNRASRNNNVSYVNDDYSNYAFLRECIVDFFNHTREMLQVIISESENESIMLIKKSLFSFRLMLKRIDNLPDFVIQNCTSEIGNECALASYHIFHVYLELFWLHFIIELKIILLDEKNCRETLLETETETEMFDTQYTWNTNSKFHPEMEKEIEWLLYNLISLANKSYEKMGSKSIFACSCVKEIWLAVQILLENLSKENRCSDFWTYFNSIITKYVLQIKYSTDEKKSSCNTLYNMEIIKCNKPNEFALCLLLKTAQLQRFDDRGENKSTESNRIIANFELLEVLIKRILSSEQTISEIVLRELMIQINQLLSMWTEPKNEVITLLWEYFHKRLNCTFSLPGKEDSNASFQNLPVSDIVLDLKSRIPSADNIRKRDTKLESSFNLFNALLGARMKRSILLNQPSLCQKIKGRILPKFTLNKILALNEYGLKHFSMTFLVMAMATDIGDMCGKLQELILQIPMDNLPFIKKQIIMKTHLIILYLYVDDNQSIMKAALPVKSIMMKYCTLRDSESMSFVKMTLNGCLDVMDASLGFQNDEYILIDSWITKYLSVCNLADTYSILESFSSLLSKLQILCSYQINLNESVSSMVEVFFRHIFTSIKTMYSNNTPALQLADLAFRFGKFVLDNNLYAEKYGSFRSILQYFTNIENSNERVTRHYLMLILQDDQILQSMEFENKDCQSSLIHCWIKCALLSTEDPTDDDTQLMLLICQLNEFSSLNITPDYGGMEQKNLCKFFYAIRKAWDSIQESSEKNDFKRRVTKYLTGIDKYVSKILKNPSSLDYMIQLFITLGTLFLHCSPIIYTRADPTCLLHIFISTILLPPQLFMEKKIHHYITASICKSWYLFMRGLYQLDYKNDAYIEKAMRDMVTQYMPFFVEKTISIKESTYIVSHRMLPNECSDDLQLEQYILEKIAVNFVACRGKQCHVHSTKALSILQNLTNTANINLLYVIVSCTLLPVFEQLMFSDLTNPNKKLSSQIVSNICNNAASGNEHDVNIRSEVKDVLIKTCQKHLAFNSNALFKLVISVIPLLGSEQMISFLPVLKMEISKVEKMRGVGYDQGLRNGINEIEASVLHQ